MSTVELKLKQPKSLRNGATATLIIDTDVHEYFESVEVLLPYLEPQWQRYITQFGWKDVPAAEPYLPPVVGGSFRADWKKNAGSDPGSDLRLLQRQLFDGEGISIAILNGSFRVSAMEGWFEFAAALATAYNDWEIEEWLDKDARLRGSVHVVAHDPLGAAREIDRVGPHPQVIQVFLPLATDRQYGDPYYRPIFEAAARNELAIALHHGAQTKTVLGYPRYFVEWHAAIPQAMMSQIASILFGGVFDRFENLKVVALESGITWVPHFMWRLDHQYKSFRIEVPWVKRLPSDHLREHLRVASQPIEELKGGEFLQLIDQMGSDRMLVFATDYPHFDADSPLASLPPRIPEDLVARIMHLNAEETFPGLLT